MSAPATAAPSAKTIAFTDPDGNRFIFPGWIIRDDTDDMRSTADFWGQACFMAGRMDAKHEPLTFNPDQFPNIRASAGSSVFAHGGEDVLLFAGPVFDRIAAEQGA